MSRPKTDAEVREEFLQYLATISSYWAGLPDKTPIERCNGLAFSILNIFDGTAMALPAMNISLAPHEDDKQFMIDEGQNWYEPGQIINDATMHDLWHRYERDR